MQIDWLLLVSRWLHLLAAIVAVGGAFYARTALMPAAKSALDESTHERLREGIRRRWSIVIMACIAVLLVTGSLNFYLLAWPPKIEPMPYHAIFGVKLLIAFVIFFIASALVGRSPGLAEFRRKNASWLSWLLALAIAIVLVSGVLSQVRQQQYTRPAPGSDVNAADV